VKWKILCTVAIQLAVTMSKADTAQAGDTVTIALREAFRQAIQVNSLDQIQALENRYLTCQGHRAEAYYLYSNAGNFVDQSGWIWLSAPDQNGWINVTAQEINGQWAPQSFLRIYEGWGLASFFCGPSAGVTMGGIRRISQDKKMLLSELLKIASDAYGDPYASSKYTQSVSTGAYDAYGYVECRIQ